MVQTGDDYREQNKKRLQRYFQKHLSEGKKRITALLDGEVYALLIDHKDKEGISIGAAVENALRVAYGEKVEVVEHSVQPPLKKEAKEKVEVVQQSVGEPPKDNPVVEHIVPPLESDTDDRDRRLIEIYESLPGRENAQRRADALNEAGVYIKGGVWNKKNAGDLYRKAKAKQGGD